MSTRPPKLDPRRAAGAPLPRARDADYSDEITTKQIDALRRYYPQDESKMGPVVDELTW